MMCQPYPDALFIADIPKGNSKRFEAEVNYAFEILKNNVFLEQERDYWIGQHRKSPENISHLVWKEAYAYLKGLGKDLTFKGKE